MKRLIRTIAISSMAFIASCTGSTNNSDASNTTNEQSMGAEHTTTAMHPGAKLDPVCEMQKDDTWTEYTIHNQDTVWFCSEGCKKAFVARPEKYMKES